MKDKLKKEWPILGTYIYIILPTLLFVLLWLKVALSAVLCALILFGVWCACRDEDELWRPEKDRTVIAKLVVVLALVCLWVLYSGIGGSVVQYPDHMYRNTVYRMLVDEEWPIRMLTDSGDERSLSYYMGFWMPAALFAKITGSYSAGLLFQQIWAVLGLIQVYYFLCEKFKRVRLWYLGVFVFFGGLDAIGRKLTMDYYTQIGNRFEWWAVIFNYPSFSNHLFWVYNQLIYALLIYCLIDRQKTNRSILFVWSMALLPSTLPAVGMIPFAVYRALQNTESGQKLVLRLKQLVMTCLSPANGVGFLVALLMTMYLLPNQSVSATLPDMLSGDSNTMNNMGQAIGTDPTFHAYPWTTKLWMYLMFALLEFGLYFMLIYRSQGSKPIFWISLAVLLICPWINIGYYNDFCMRASIPALFCLMELIIFALQDYRKKKRFLLLPALAVALMIGSLSAVDTLQGAMHDTVDLMANKEQVNLSTRYEGEVIVNDNFSSGTDTFFFRYLMK